MFIRQDQLEKAIFKLTIWLKSIELCGTANLLNIHNISEDFCCELLNKIFQWDLKNLNSTQHNAEGVDLIDEKNKIIIQVSAEKRKAKIEETLIRADKPIYKGYKLYMMFLVNEYNPRKNVTYNPSCIFFDLKNNIIDISQLIKKIKSLSYILLDEVCTYIDEQIQGVDLDYRLTSDLTEIIRILASKDSVIYNRKESPLGFRIQDKIECNNININKEIIEKFNDYYYIMQEIYDAFDIEAINTGEAVWEKIAQFSRDIQMDEGLEGDKLFSKIWRRCSEYVSLDTNLSEMSQEKIERYCKIIVVDAFIRCKVMKAPRKKDEYAVAN